MYNITGVNFCKQFKLFHNFHQLMTPELQVFAVTLNNASDYRANGLMGRIHGAIVAAIAAATGRSDRRVDRSPVAATIAPCIHYRQPVAATIALVARLNMFT